MGIFEQTFSALEKMKTYYLTMRWKTIIFLWSAIYTGLIFGLFAYFLRFFLVLYVILGVVSLVSTVYYLCSTKIIVTDKGIEYHIPLVFVIEIAWGEIDEIGYHWFREGMFIERNSINIKHANRNTYATFMGYGQSAFIPLSSFSNNWRDSKLGQQIKQYAPHLFK
jgi:hypothetical protein